LVDAGWQPANLYYIPALPLLLAMAAVLFIRMVAPR
jgi:hypothetical protein